MQLYRRGAHTVFDLKYHLVWSTKYRKPVLSGSVALRTREVIREICRTLGIQIVKGHVSKDHVHLFLSIPPNLSIAKVAQYVKGKTSRKLLMEFRHLQKAFWGQHLWGRGYFAVSSGQITDEMIMEYIAHQDEDEKKRGDDFTITDM